MYLEKLEIQGFKSFANKNQLIFPGMLTAERRGITAVVGPNGSGKSNIADSIRWVLGEQSMKMLRGKRSEDVIFSGSVKLGKLGMAEVSLHLNNEDRKAPIDYSQFVLTRRLYRDGVSEYLINGSRVRLADVQILLAKAKFGQKTYSVIGQGMVEGFLNTSLAERKEFFDEATGIKQYQLKRDDSLNKLKNTYDNLSQAQMIVLEIEPRLRSLTRQVNKLQRREEIESSLRELQLSYYRQAWHEINDKFSALNGEILEIEKVRLDRDKKLSANLQKLNQLEKQKGPNGNFSDYQVELSRLQNQKESINKQLAKIEAALEIKLEASGNFDLSWLNNKKRELANETKLLDDQISALAASIGEITRDEQVLRTERERLAAEIKTLNENFIKKHSGSGNDNIKKIDRDLKILFSKLERAEQEEEPAKVRSILKEIKEDLKKILEISAETGVEPFDFQGQSKLLELAEKQETVIVELNRKTSDLSIRAEKLKMLKEMLRRLSDELTGVEKKLAAGEKNELTADNEGAQAELMGQAGEIEKQISELKNSIAVATQKEAEERTMLFDLQKNIQNFQQELNDLNQKLNDLKISSTRYETRLEDLDAEIRKELGGLKEVQEARVSEAVELGGLSEKIQALKRQLDQIGGIDAEVEKEYQETKERFDFLSSQTSDLENTILSLEKIIEELDLIIKERFDKEFKEISTKFEEYFKILFSGGVAKIIKVMESDLEEEEEGSPTPKDEAEGEKTEKADPQTASTLKKIKFLQKHNATGLAGIEIQATPPGKKIKTVAMLSGGERALTAIALICAIINVNPSPFVVLDEVDAALDESNSERLAKILDDLSHKTQFIVITHNRASMRRANVLYGITMGDDGVSKLLSVKLDEAEAKVAS
jgi:chromosome segregation protein